MQNKMVLIQIVYFLKYQGQIKVPTSVTQWDMFASDIEKSLPCACSFLFEGHFTNSRSKKQSSTKHETSEAS